LLPPITGIAAHGRRIPGKTINFNYSLVRSRRSFAFNRTGSTVSCQPLATPVMLDQKAIHNKIGITILLGGI